MDSLGVVVSYFNGNGTTVNCTDVNAPDGRQFQCVEFIRRYYRLAVGCGSGSSCDTAKWMGPIVGNADTFFPAASQLGLEAHVNRQDLSMPLVRDIIAYAGLKGGHVAFAKTITSWTEPNTWLVYVIEQNVLPSATSLPLFLTRDPATGLFTLTDNLNFAPFPSLSIGYPAKFMSRLGTDYRIQGWLRKRATPISIAVPNALANTAANSNLGDPSNTVSHIQQVFGSSQFGAISGARTITDIAFRPSTNLVQGRFAPQGWTLSNVTVTLSVTSAGPNSLSGVFEANFGPTQGNLLLDIQNFSSKSLIGEPFEVTLLQGFPVTIIEGQIGATIGPAIPNTGFVTQFTFQ